MSRKETSEELKKELTMAYRKASLLGVGNGIVSTNSIPKLRKAIELCNDQINMVQLKSELQGLLKIADNIVDIHQKVKEDVNVSLQYLLLMRKGVQPNSERPSKKSFTLLEEVISSYRKIMSKHVNDLNKAIKNK